MTNLSQRINILLKNNAKKIVNTHKNKQKMIKQLHKKRFYAFLTSVLLILLLMQVVKGLYLNFSKLIVLHVKHNKLEIINKSANTKNKELKILLAKYNSPAGIEEMVRNTLKMVGPNEVLLVIKRSQDKE